MHAPRLAVATAAAVATVTLVAGPAGAHVTIPDPVAAGGIDEVTLTVPNERDDAGTVALEVKLPEAHPLPLVDVRAKPGWQSEVTMRTLDAPVELWGREVTEVVDTVRWTGGRIDPGQYDSFTFRAGPFPDDVEELVVPVIQTYDSGEEVGWIELAVDDGAEPAHPAPIVVLTASSGGTTGAHGEATAPDGSAGAEVDEAAAGVAADGGTDTLGVVSLVVAVVALGLGAVALAATRRRA